MMGCGNLGNTRQNDWCAKWGQVSSLGIADAVVTLDKIVFTGGGGCYSGG